MNEVWGSAPARVRGLAPAFLLASLLLPLTAGAQSGAALYAQNCALCHQANAGGTPGQYPPLRDRVDVIAASAAGRHYLGDLLLNGMAGAITAGGAIYVGYMPPWRQLPDDSIAAVLSYLAGLGTTRPAPVIAAGDIASLRGTLVTPTAVHAERAALAAQHPLP